ncbi:MAG TPA: hypothetical protein VFY23_09840 [Candidatus Limnocylindrales bacterium]|nr:hypothetical protein [Candidatus Limnocylindrales bacterium]
MANLVDHFEIHATEPERLVEFYSSLLVEGGYLLDPDGNALRLISPVLPDGAAPMDGTG